MFRITELHRASVVAALTAALVATVSGDAHAATAATRERFIAAEAAAARGDDPRWRVLAADLDGYVLAPYVEFAALGRDLERRPAADIEAFLAREGGTFIGEQLRTRWLDVLAKRRDWPRFNKSWRERDDLEQRCARFEARRATGDEAGLREPALALWTRGETLPPACAALDPWLGAAGALDAMRVTERVMLAISARNPALVRTLAERLEDDTARDARLAATIIGAPADALAKAASYPDSAIVRHALIEAVTRAAASDPALAGARFNALAPRFAFTDDERGRAVGAIALSYATSYLPEAADWYARLPTGTGSAAAREWRLRAALAASDFEGAVRAFDGLDEAGRADPRLRYAAARARELSGDAAGANAGFAALAIEANFFGFLAADRVGAGYSICPLDASRDPLTRSALDAERGLARAFELREIDRIDAARREWNFTVPTLAPALRAAAAARAREAGWLDRGPLTLLGPEVQRFYAERFPIGHRRRVEAAAKRNDIDPAWVFALIRSESAWNATARSHADARGLMQLLPSTAASVAKREGITWRSAADLYQPHLNIRLGTRYMATRRDTYDGRLWLATAAYNAGPAPVARWLTARPDLPPDLWAETVSYRETREYIARVMAFSVIYDWLLGGDVRRLSERMGMPLAAGVGATTTVACALPAPTPEAPIAPPVSRSINPEGLP